MCSRPELRRLALLAVAAALQVPSAASAQSDSPATRKPGDDRSVALVISGGASLGVYEAGYLYALGEVLKRQGDTLRVATGASAGSGNALLAALSSCTPANDFPTRDLGYRFWLAQSFDSLYQADSSTAVSAFIATPGLADLRRLLREVWQRRLPVSCDVSVGIAVTRLIPLDVALTDRLTVPRQLLYFTIRIRGRGDSLPPVITNTVDPASRAPRLLLPLAPDPGADNASSQNRDRLLQVIAASGAFPFAFPPVTLGYCIYPAVDPAACRATADTSADTLGTTRRIHHDLFIDGGVFDNIPLGLASTLSRSHPQTRFFYIDPDLRAYPVAAPRASGSPSDALGQALVIADGFVGQARKTELFALLEGRSAVLDTSRLFIASNRFPQASGFLHNFFGLFEREFRRFDFYLGMYDALGDVASWPVLPSDRGRQALEALLPSPDWQPLRCLQEWYDSIPATRSLGCESDSLRDFRILAQIAVNRVYSDCRDLGDRLSPAERDSIANSHCRRAAHGVLPPTIARAVPPLDSTQVLRDTSREETDLDYNLRLLAAYGFQFRDLGIPPDQPKRARRVLAGRLREVIENLAERQPRGSQRSLLRLATLAVADIYYEPSPSWRYLVMGTAQEIGAVQAVAGLPDWLRLNGALRVQGIISLLTRDPNEFAAGLFLGPDVELRPITNAKYMITVAPRVGYQLSQGDRFGSVACGAARTHGDGRDCSQVVLQGVASFIAIERIRLQASFDYFPRRVAFDNRSYNIELALGVQF
jgi:predicted acylesterase/phospholipase RssA